VFGTGFLAATINGYNNGFEFSFSYGPKIGINHAQNHWHMKAILGYRVTERSSAPMLSRKQGKLAVWKFDYVLAVAGKAVCIVVDGFLIRAFCCHAHIIR